MRKSVDQRTGYALRRRIIGERRRPEQNVFRLPPRTAAQVVESRGDEPCLAPERSSGLHAAFSLVIRRPGISAPVLLEAVREQRVVFPIPVGYAVPPLAAGARDCIGQIPGSAAIFGGEVGSRNAVFLDGLRR